MIKLNKTLGEDYRNDFEDVHNVKRALNVTGHYEIPEYGLTKYADKRLFESIRSFQKQENLKIDGLMTPDGQTIVALNKRINSDNPAVRSPTIRCPQCGAPHGGSKGDLCPDCYSK